MGVGEDAGVGFAGYGYHDAQGNWVPASVDMRNGGGAGRAGNTFMGGGMYSGLLNMFGVRPEGYNDIFMSQEEADAFRAANMDKGPKNPALSQVLATTAMAQPMPMAPMAASYYPSYAMSMPLSGMGGMMPNMTYA
jgi:hypothetical protein